MTLDRRRTESEWVVPCAALLVSLCALPTLAGPVPADAVAGLWFTAGADACVQIYEEGGLYNGRIVGLADPVVLEGDALGRPGEPRTDIHNPDESLRDRPLIGLPFLSGFRYEGGAWTGGTIYDPESGKTYKCKLTLEEDGRLKVRGYVGLTAFGRTELWMPAAGHIEGVEHYLARLKGMLPAPAP